MIRGLLEVTEYLTENAPFSDTHSQILDCVEAYLQFHQLNPTTSGQKLAFKLLTESCPTTFLPFTYALTDLDPSILTLTPEMLAQPNIFVILNQHLATDNANNLFSVGTYRPGMDGPFRAPVARLEQRNLDIEFLKNSCNIIL